MSKSTMLSYYYVGAGNGYVETNKNAPLELRDCLFTLYYF